jgi:hypothetical protein
MRTPSTPGLLLVLATVAVLPRAAHAEPQEPPPAAAPAPAAAGERDACATSAEEAQALRRAGKLAEARDQLRACSAASCPEPVRTDCSARLAEVEKTLAAPIDLSSLQAETTVPRPRPPPARAPAADPEPVDNFGKAVPGATWALGGLAFVFTAVGVVLWSTGTSDHDEMEAGCARTRTCVQSDVDSAKTKLLVGDVAVGLGLVAIGAAVYFALTAPKPPSTPAVRAGAAGFRF